MAKYHLSEKGPRPCRAIKRSCPVGREHFITIEEAKRAYEDKISQETVAVTPLRKDFIPKKKLLLHKKLNQLGFENGFAKDCKVDFYHESSKPLPEVGKITDVLKDKNPQFSLFTKPGGCLWLSPGASDSSGKVMTDWRKWCIMEEFNMVGEESLLHKAEFAPHSLILELNESNLSKVSKIISDDLILPSPPKSFAESLMRLNNVEENFYIPWHELKIAGVDAVRVNGRRERAYFYGYDCDSLIILKGDCISGWSRTEKATAKTDFDLNCYNTSGKKLF